MESDVHHCLGLPYPRRRVMAYHRYGRASEASNHVSHGNKMAGDSGVDDSGSVGDSGDSGSDSSPNSSRSSKDAMDDSSRPSPTIYLSASHRRSRCSNSNHTTNSVGSPMMSSTKGHNTSNRYTKERRC